ncbi:MAG: hypothetical protein AAGA21_20565 [Pseudomonadota bacterium]
MAQSVKIGGSATLDSCSAGIVVEDLGRAAVRAAPAATAEQVDQLTGGKIVWLCDQARGWIGVIYGDGDLEDCGVSTPVADRTAYAGLCKAGWIKSANVSLLAG